MGRRRVFQRTDRYLQLHIADEGLAPAILPFTRRERPTGIALSDVRAPRSAILNFGLTSNASDPLTRARILHENVRCPECRRVGVIPLDMGDGDRRHAAMPVPGTATLVGFYCQSCGAEWAI